MPATYATPISARRSQMLFALHILNTMYFAVSIGSTILYSTFLTGGGLSTTIAMLS
jgi:hypothetical protein